jgi:hypothetical protein
MATPDSSDSGAGSAREEAERLVAAVLARASEGASQAAWMAQGAKFAARASGHQTTSTGLGMLGDALRGVATAASGYSEDLHKAAEGTKPARATAPTGTGTARRAPGSAPTPGGATPAAAADPVAPVVADAPGPVTSSAVHDGTGGHGTQGAQDGHNAQGAAGQQRVGFATGSAECCVCPVCRAITMVRNPTPEFAEQLATSAGDLAAGVAGLLRAFSTAAADSSSWSAGGPGSTGTAGPGATRASEPAAAGPATGPADGGKSGGRATHESSGTGWPAADPWAAATRAAASEQHRGDPWAAATRDTRAGHPADSDVPGTGDHGRDFREAG